MENVKKDFATFIGTILGRRWFMLQQNRAEKPFRKLTAKTTPKSKEVARKQAKPKAR